MTDALDLPAVRAARQARKEFLDRLEPLRKDLYAYCRRLTGNAFDAEDLVQESLARAFNQAAQANAPIERPRAWRRHEHVRRHLPQAAPRARGALRAGCTGSS